MYFLLFSICGNVQWKRTVDIWAWCHFYCADSHEISQEKSEMMVNVCKKKKKKRKAWKSNTVVDIYLTYTAKYGHEGNIKKLPGKQKHCLKIHSNSSFTGSKAAVWGKISWLTVWARLFLLQLWLPVSILPHFPYLNSPGCHRNRAPFLWPEPVKADTNMTSGCGLLQRQPET